ncbi:hypothetical protein CSE16_01535 [Solibacillus sp. R5-41]|uniref:YfjL-like protein n=1 Tax=Solibacillus sp. R5-41 TaxID=2048654 RepID=UPI000C126240|nr:hypothetical protein [Solibacillus sp. R5-41]ATP38800.1 hypothetical protein CSE16_01535 [Solibacillus sp. R5-41]
MKKWFFRIAALVIIAGVVFLYVSFNGNFISKKIAKNSAEEYLQLHYPNGNYTLGDGHFNFKDNSYLFNFTFRDNNNAWTYSLNVGHGLRPTEATILMLHTDSADDDTTKKWREAGTSYIKNLLADFPIVTDFSYDIDVPKGFTQFTPEWTPNVNVPVAPTLYFEMAYDGETEEQFLQAVKDIQKKIDAGTLFYRSAYVAMYEKVDNRDGRKKGYAPIYYEEKYSIRFEPQQNLTIDAIY